MKRKKKAEKNKTIILFCTPDRKISFSHLVLRCYAWISVNQYLKSCWLKYGYKNIQFVTWLINNLIFCLSYKVLCLLVFVRGGLIYVLSNLIIVKQLNDKNVPVFPLSAIEMSASIVDRIKGWPKIYKKYLFLFQLSQSVVKV